ncbi:hypothetical protein BX600DRAFT_517319 [Xylariales sp. PMI_506]|nr:hypothetical protein BX600DRAFT_517319 [Xylariales sp. PMI_506]
MSPATLESGMAAAEVDSAAIPSFLPVELSRSSSSSEDTSAISSSIGSSGGRSYSQDKCLSDSATSDDGTNDAEDSQAPCDSIGSPCSCREGTASDKAGLRDPGETEQLTATGPSPTPESTSSAAIRTQFSHLPPELRTAIWELAAPATTRKIFCVTNRRRKAKDGTGGTFVVRYPPPAVAQVCRESRSLLRPALPLTQHKSNPHTATTATTDDVWLSESQHGKPWLLGTAEGDHATITAVSSAVAPIARDPECWDPAVWQWFDAARDSIMFSPDVHIGGGGPSEDGLLALEQLLGKKLRHIVLYRESLHSPGSRVLESLMRLDGLSLLSLVLATRRLDLRSRETVHARGEVYLPFAVDVDDEDGAVAEVTALFEATGLQEERQSAAEPAARDSEDPITGLATSYDDYEDNESHSNDNDWTLAVSEYRGLLWGSSSDPGDEEEQGDATNGWTPLADQEWDAYVEFLQDEFLWARHNLDRPTLDEDPDFDLGASGFDRGNAWVRRQLRDHVPRFVRAVLFE